MPLRSHDDEDQVREEQQDREKKRVTKDFDCPSCNANNPRDAPFQDREEVICNYCGTEYRVTVFEEGRVKFKEI